MDAVNHDILINKLRWKTVTQEFTGLQELRLDCFRFVFQEGGLNQEQQELLVEFLGNSAHLNSLTPVDFCNMFCTNSITFKLEFAYAKQCGLRYNYQGFRLIRKLNKFLKLEGGFSDVCSVE